MRKIITSITSVLACVLITLAAADDAEARRFGGGKSFGSRPSYTNPYQRSAVPKQQALQQQQAAAKNQGLRDSLARRGGLMGMLGGLALGGLLGALLFGGAFEHLNFLDLLVFGLIAFMLYKLFAARKRMPDIQQAAGVYGRQERQGFPLNDLERKFEHARRGVGKNEPEPQARKTPVTSPLDEGDATFEDRHHAAALPSDFNESAFLAGAKSAYEHLQAAWDRRDLADIRGLTSDKVFAEIQAQLREREGENHTDVLKVDAELLEAREIGNDLEATVLFDVILRETPDEHPHQVREVWHFTRSKLSPRPTWFLDGIQQLQDR